MSIFDIIKTLDLPKLNVLQTIGYSKEDCELSSSEDYVGYMGLTLNELVQTRCRITILTCCKLFHGDSNLPTTKHPKGYWKYVNKLKPTFKYGFITIEPDYEKEVKDSTLDHTYFVFRDEFNDIDGSISHKYYRVESDVNKKLLPSVKEVKFVDLIDKCPVDYILTITVPMITKKNIKNNIEKMVNKILAFRKGLENTLSDEYSSLLELL